MERDGTHQKTIITEEDFNSHAHVERDWQMVLNVSCFCHFNSHAHVERDYPSSFALSKLSISTHTLTWSVTWSENSAVKSSYFNSHAHVERDFVLDPCQFGKVISTHTLTWSVTKILL